jgi:hypothetical protein
MSELRRKIQSIEINKDVSGCFLSTRAHLAHAPWQPNLIRSQYLRLYDALSPARFIISSLVDKFILRFIDCEKRDQGGRRTLRPSHLLPLVASGSALDGSVLCVCGVCWCLGRETRGAYSGEHYTAASVMSFFKSARVT